MANENVKMFIVQQIVHWLSTPTHGYLGSNYGIDLAAELQKPLSDFDADRIINKLYNDVPILSKLNRDYVNIYHSSNGIDDVKIFISVGGIDGSSSSIDIDLLAIAESNQNQVISKKMAYMQQMEEIYTETPVTPPVFVASLFPNIYIIKQNGYGQNIISLEVGKTGTSIVTSNNGYITGVQNASIITTGKYMEKSTISTKITQIVNTSKLANLAGVLFYDLLKLNTVDITGMLSADNYWGAYQEWVKNTYIVINNITGGDESAIENIVDGFNTDGSSSSSISLQYDALSKQAIAAESAKKTAILKGDVRALISAAAAEKAANELANAAKNNDTSLSSNTRIRYMRLELKPGTSITEEKNLLSYPVGFYVTDMNNSTWTNKMMWTYYNAKTGERGNLRYQSSEFIDMAWSYSPLNIGIWPDYNSLTLILRMIESTWGEYKNLISPVTQNLTLLTAGEIEKILKEMLDSTNSNHRAAMDTLAVISKNTSTIDGSIRGSNGIWGGDNSIVGLSTESSSAAISSTLSSPYTPLGSNSAQVTEFTINSDGSIVSEIVIRDDLVANSPEAPTTTIS